MTKWFYFLVFMLTIFLFDFCFANETDEPNMVTVETDSPDNLDEIPEAQNSRHRTEEDTILSNQRGRPIPSMSTTLRIGKGFILLSDVNYIDQMAHFDRERIPQRVAHAKGSGAFGYFECTADITQFTKAAIFSHVGKKTETFVRFSTTLGDLGSPDTAIDRRGFATKFFTEQGILSIVGNALPLFPISDPILFISLIHSGRSNPQSNLKDSTATWDFLSLRTESTLHSLMSFADIGFPKNFRHMTGSGIHTFKLVNQDGEISFARFHWRPDLGMKNVSIKTYIRWAGENPDKFGSDLFNAIKAGNYPSWTLYMQFVSVKQAASYKWNIFDPTKILFEKDFPLVPVGRLVLNRNPRNFFADVEMAAFSPGDLIPGIELSQDPLFIGRAFSYGDSQRHRLGPNFLQLPANRPKTPHPPFNYDRDGACVQENFGPVPHYFPNSFSKPNVGLDLGREFADTPFVVHGTVDRVEQTEADEEDHLSQPRVYLSDMSNMERKRLANGLAFSLVHVVDTVQKRQLGIFEKVNADFAKDIKRGIEKLKAKTKKQKNKAPTLPTNPHWH